MKGMIAHYKNGNAMVSLFADGTRIINTEDDEFNFEVPLSIDLKVTNRCNKGCAMCHEDSNPNGKHAQFSIFKFLESWGSGKEVAIGGGSVTCYPYFEELLHLIKALGLFANVTFHQDELLENFEAIKRYQEEGLIHGIGVSYSHEDDKLFGLLNTLDNVVIHVIAGLIRSVDLMYLQRVTYKPKLLILGYKTFRRGNILYGEKHDIIEENIEELRLSMSWLLGKHSPFVAVSFDNLALEQLNVKAYVPKKLWDLYYQGDEGTCSMYIDAVEGQYAVNSTSTIRKPISEDIKTMFQDVKEQAKND